MATNTSQNQSASGGDMPGFLSQSFQWRVVFVGSVATRTKSVHCVKAISLQKFLSHVEQRLPVLSDIKVLLGEELAPLFIILLQEASTSKNRRFITIDSSNAQAYEQWWSRSVPNNAKESLKMEIHVVHAKYYAGIYEQFTKVGKNERLGQVKALSAITNPPTISLKRINQIRLEDSITNGSPTKMIATEDWFPSPGIKPKKKKRNNKKGEGKNSRKRRRSEVDESQEDDEDIEEANEDDNGADNGEDNDDDIGKDASEKNDQTALALRPAKKIKLSK